MGKAVKFAVSISGGEFKELETLRKKKASPGADLSARRLNFGRVKRKRKDL